MAEDSISIVVPKEMSPAEADEFWRVRSMQIPRFPPDLRRFGREKDFIAPRTVAIGPYYHGVAELQPMEEIKRMVAGSFFQGLPSQSWEATYEEIKSIALNVRCCYTDKEALQGISDDKFAEMMFIDGCFLVEFICMGLGRSVAGVALGSIISLHDSGISRDIMLLENQIPWAVMEVLFALKGVMMENVIHIIEPMLHGFFEKGGHEKWPVDMKKEDYKPSHLLCLTQFFESSAIKKTTTRQVPPMKAVPTCTSAVELAEMGIKLEASRAMQFSAMDIVTGPCCARLLLAPVYIDAHRFCWLVNMAAFERWSQTLTGDFSVNIYLLVFSFLMNREEDVRELRVKRIVLSPSSDRQTLEFFNDLAPNLCTGRAYWDLIFKLEAYKKERRMWIAIYRFVYKHGKIIATVLPIVGVLVGILKALLSLKQPSPA